MRRFIKNIGPGPLVAAAFIGPGTVTLCTLAGIHFGYALLWAITISVIATIILQEMAARIGIVTQKGLSENIRVSIESPLLRYAIITLIVLAVILGNTAYEAGNIAGGVLGIASVFGSLELSLGGYTIGVWPMVIGVSAFVILYLGNYKYLERILIALVVVMSLAFLATSIIVKPNITSIVKGMFLPKLPENSIIMAIGLIGTTVVPYNLFLHASLAKTKWKNTTDLRFARKDTFIAVILGGLVSMSIIVVASSVNLTDVNTAADLAQGLKPLFGDGSSLFLSIGLFAAGITSAITAPLAASFVACGCFGWDTNLKSKHFRMVWMLILCFGVLFASLGVKPISIITFAQVANGLLLPIIVLILLWMMNKSLLLGHYKNKMWQNILGVIILGITLFLSGKTMLSVFNGI